MKATLNDPRGGIVSKIPFVLNLFVCSLYLILFFIPLIYRPIRVYPILPGEDQPRMIETWIRMFDLLFPPFRCVFLAVVFSVCLFNILVSILCLILLRKKNNLCFRLGFAICLSNILLLSYSIICPSCPNVVY